MDGYFKLLRAEEEIQRLNVEIPRFATYIRDENHYLHTVEQLIHTSHPALAFQIFVKRTETGRYDTLHMKILNKITSLKGFTGGSLFGTHIPEASAVSLPVRVTPVTQLQPSAERMAAEEEIDRDEDFEEEQAGEDRDVAVLGAYFSVIEFSYDDATTLAHE